MFVYEKSNSLNLTFKGSIPVDKPEIVIKGYKDGATLTVNDELVLGSGSEEFEGKAKTFVFQRSGELMITFNGFAGIDTPDVVLNETEKGTVEVTIGEKTVTLMYDDEKVTVKDAPATNSVELPAEETEEESETELVENDLLEEDSVSTVEEE